LSIEFASAMTGFKFPVSYYAERIGDCKMDKWDARKEKEELEVIRNFLLWQRRYQGKKVGELFHVVGKRDFRCREKDEVILREMDGLVVYVCHCHVTPGSGLDILLGGCICLIICMGL